MEKGPNPGSRPGLDPLSFTLNEGGLEARDLGGVDLDARAHRRPADDKRSPTSYMRTMTDPSEQPDDVTLIYDGECPVCTAYSGAADTGAAELKRINARSQDPEVQRAIKAGFDLDEGMIVLHKGELYHGADAVHRMALLAPRTGLRNRINRLIFGNLAVARAVYPSLRAGRNALLRLLGRRKIGALDNNS